jgi:hypothetical protein
MSLNKIKIYFILFKQLLLIYIMKKNKQMINNISWQLHTLLLNNNLKEISEIVDIIKESDYDNGIITNLILYYIKINDENKINYFLENCKLMKRDYLNVIVYDKKYLYLFDTIIDNFELLDKDLDFIINNKLNVLHKLDGFFLKNNCNYKNTIDTNLLKLYYLDEKSIELMLNLIEKEIIITDKMKDLLKNNYDNIIDCGNIIYNKQGKINYNNLNIIKQLTGNNLLIIHIKHKKNLNNDIFKNNIYFTPYKFNDDLYILYFFLKMKTKCFIISNDKYRDHIFNFNISEKFKNIITQQTINYNLDENKINNYPKFSNCIQVIDDFIFIP